MPCAYCLAEGRAGDLGNHLVKVVPKRALADSLVEQSSPKKVKTGQAGLGDLTAPIAITSSLPDKDLALLHKLNADKTHHIVAARLADEATCKRLGFKPGARMTNVDDLKGPKTK